MEINLKKTQIMIFEKRKTKARRIFYLGNQNIKIVQEYCFLGIKLNHNGKQPLQRKLFWCRKICTSIGNSRFREMEKYLTVKKDPHKRKCLSRFRVSNHNLQIEIGRYENIPRVKSVIQERWKTKLISSSLVKPMSNPAWTSVVH